MKYLVVNADDFGYSAGVNRGIIDAHLNGIVTATSVMVDAVAADEAAELHQYKNLDVGLHLVLDDSDDIIRETDRQIEKLRQITGFDPTHIDPHKSNTWAAGRRDAVAAYLEQKNIPFRYSDHHNFIGSFMAMRSDGDVSVDQLMKSLDEVIDGVNEMLCHVGYADEYLRTHSSYATPREQELESITSHEIKDYIARHEITLTNWTTLGSGVR